MWATTEMDIVLGIDVHIVMVPTPGGPVPTPLPHPFTGFVFNPLDWIPFFNKVRVHNFPAASVASGGNPVPKHIPTPPGTMWAKGMVGNDAMMLLGGLTVSANGKPMTYAGLIVLSCSCIGTPPAPVPNDPKKMSTRQKLNTISYLPTSVVTPVPKGLQPVLIGCPPTTDLFALAFAIAFKALLVGAGGLLRAAQRSNWMQKFVARYPNLGNFVNRVLCRFTGDPVDVATGKVVTENIDFSIPGPIPFIWERVWYSTSNYQGPIGHGWHHRYDLSLQAEFEFNRLIIRMADGRCVYFPILQPGENAYNRQEKLDLQRDDSTYLLKNAEGHTYRFNIPDKNSALQRLISIENNGGFGIRFTYNGLGHLQSIVDSAGRVFTIQNGIGGRISAILAPHPDRPGDTFPIVRYRYDHAGNLIEVLDALDHAAAYAYQRHLLIKRTDRNGLSFYFVYNGENERAQCIHTWGDGGIYNHKLTYNNLEKWTVVENSLGHKTKYFWNDLGLVIKTVDPLGNERQTKYDADCQLIREVDELGQATAYYYDEFGNQTGILYPDGSTIQFKFENNRRVATTDQNGGSWQWLYDDKGRLVGRIDAMGNKTYFQYDQKGLLTTIIDPAGGITEFQYDKVLNLRAFTTPDGATSAWEYDLLGRCTTAIDPKGNVQRRKFNFLGWVRLVNEPDGNVRELEYNGEGSVIRVKDNHHDVRFEYEGMSRLKARKEADTRVEFKYNTEENLLGIINENGYAYRFELDYRGDVLVESGFDGVTRRYKRDAAGRVTDIERASGIITHYEYDSLGRITTVQHSDGSTEKFAYQPDGELLEAINDHVKITFERNKLGQVIKEMQGGFVIESKYNELGFRTELTSSLGAHVTFGCNAMGDIESINANGQSDPWNVAFKRDNLGLEIERQLPGGVRSEWKRDRLGRPIEHKTMTASGKVTRARKYVWEVNDRLKQIIDEQKGTWLFEHDIFGNLAAAQYPNGTFEYRMPDAVGNLFRTKDRSDRKYGPAGQLLEANGTHYKYDAEGNLIQKTEANGAIWHYEWNASGMLRSVVRPDGDKVTFTYDALGRRIAKKYRHKTTRWVWDGNVMLHEWVEQSKLPSTQQGISITSRGESKIKIRKRDEQIINEPSNAPPLSAIISGTADGYLTSDISHLASDDITTWLFDSKSLAPLAKLSGINQYSIVTDHLGTPVGMYNTDGLKVWEMDLSIYGAVQEMDGWREHCPFRYPGQYEDEETGLYYNRFRYYDAESGEYMSQDPIRLLGGKATYSYVKDSLRYLDPFGLSSTSGCGPGRIVLGHYPDYVNIGNSMGAHLFEIPTNVWDNMTSAERWAANQRFLDRAIARGDEIILATPLDRVKPGSYYEQELMHLIDRGIDIFALPGA